MKQSIARHIIASHTCFSRRNTPFLLEKHCVSLGETLRSSVWAHSKELLLTLLLLITGGLFPCVMAQKVADGVYYLGSRDYNVNNTTTNYYLCPTEDWKYYQSTSPYYTDTPNGQPFMTTYQCRNGDYDSNKALWIKSLKSVWPVI